MIWLGNKKEISDRYLGLWQERWTTSDKGRYTYEIWNNIKERLELKADIGHYIVQYLTGHGHFASYLHQFGLRDSPLCGQCSMDDTPGHVFYDCLRYNEVKYCLVTELVERGLTFDMKIALREAEGFRVVGKRAVEVGHIREDELV